VGIGNSSHQVIPYMMNLGMWFFSADGEPLHNPIMVIWAETGLLGLLLYLGVLISAVYSFIQQYLQSRRIGVQYLLLYYGPVAAVFLGYMASWIKGGGMETDFSYFLMLALLLIPSTLKEKSFN
jgi:O-antigen ligase